jgi:hypothetical protein
MTGAADVATRGAELSFAGQWRKVRAKNLSGTGHMGAGQLEAARAASPELHAETGAVHSVRRLRECVVPHLRTVP